MNSLQEKSCKSSNSQQPQKHPKYFKINLLKEVKEFYNENYETQMKKIVKDTKKVNVFLFMDWKIQHH